MVTVLALYKILEAEPIKIIDSNNELLYEGVSCDVPIRCMDLWVSSLKCVKGCYIIKTS